MKSTVWVTLVVMLLGMVVSNDADAQSRREKRRMEKRRRQQELFRQEQERKEELRKQWERKYSTPVEFDDTSNNVKTTPNKKGFQYPETVRKDKYRIDILAPFYLTELVQEGKPVDKYKLPSKVLGALSFYEGICLAADTLKNMGYKLDIYVYDVSDEYENPTMLVKNDALKESDLIIGMLSSHDFPPIANHVMKHNVNFISALSPSNYQITKNPYFTMLQPTLETHCDHIVERVLEKNGNITPLLLYRTSAAADSAAYDRLTNNHTISYDKILCEVMPAREQIEPYLNLEKKNVIILPIFNTQYVEDILLNLKEWFPAHNFEVWGMPTCRSMKALRKADAFPNTAVYFTNPFYFNSNTASGAALVNAYKQKYGSRVNDMVFRGYETLIWYAYLLKKYGNVFNENIWDNGGAPFTRYKISAIKDEADKILHYENKHLYLYRYQGGSYLVEQ